jgi:RNA polymerase sigma-70 factor (ECF subfamily)
VTREDVVQDAFLRYQEAEVEAESPKAYLATVTTRLAIDLLRSARARREVYPVERAVFLLREVFDYPYDEVGRIVGKSADNCRQILARAHRHVQEGRRRFEVSREEREEVSRRFLAAWEEGDTEALVELLAADATVYGDGGGKAPSVLVPLVGAQRVARALVGWGRQARERGLAHRPALVNGDPGLVFYGPDGSPVWVAAFEIEAGVVVAVRSVLNPDKLRHVKPL